MKLLIFLLLFWYSANSLAAFEISKNLNQNDRIEILKILGPGSSHRGLSSAYPLGGYSGLEIGLSRIFIPVSNLSAIGISNNDEDTISYPILSVGKGLFYNVDFFLNFVPFAQSDKIQNSSTSLRWAFHQMETWPIIFAIAANGSTSNYLNQLTTLNYGYDFIVNIKAQNLSLYFGLGSLFTSGTFVGGTQGITASGKIESENITSTHSIIGADIQFNSYFIAGEIDKFNDTFYSVKMGYRY